MFKITDTFQGYLIKGALVLICALAVYENCQILIAKNERIKSQEEKIVKLNQDNEKLKTELAKKAKSETVTETAKQEVKQAEVKVDKAKTQANLYVEKKLADIEKKYAAMEQTAANQERKRTEISLERAKGLWLTFCLQEPLEQACK